jgi:hypothetical protein
LITIDWRKLYKVEFHNLYSSPNTIKAIKYGRPKRAGYAEGDIKSAYNILVAGDHLGDLGVDGRMI